MTEDENCGAADPLDQRSTVGWKAIHTACILQDAFLVRCESSATDEDDFDVTETSGQTDSDSDTEGDSSSTDSGSTVTTADDSDL